MEMTEEVRKTFIIDNGLMYSCRTLYFVEAPEDFELWFRDSLVSWLKDHELTGDKSKIVGVCDSVTWRACDMSTMTYQVFLSDSLRVEDFDYSETPPEPRPTYRGV